MPPTPSATVVAPHPDDEVFGVGGFMRELVARRYQLRLVAVTDGEAAFGTVGTAERARLIAVRESERHEALVALGVADRTEVVRLGIPDAAVAEHEEALAERLAELAGPLLVATWRQDGHPDHEATGRAAALAAARRSARLLEHPVWAALRGRLREHLSNPVTRRRLSAPTRTAKVAAVHAFRSQLEPSPDARPVVPRQLVEHVCAADEVLFG